MKFVYKIYSGYDGFTPESIQQRLRRGLLRLSWKRYLDSVEKGQEVWIYFHGSQKFQSGVYATGNVARVESEDRSVSLRLKKCRIESPITDAVTSTRIGDLVGVRGRQVFIFPEQWEGAESCEMGTTARSCKNRLCGTCPTWKRLPLVKPSALTAPPRLPQDLIEAFVPAYWVIPNRCYLYREGWRSKKVQLTSELFMRFKIGEDALAFPLALGISEALRHRKLGGFDHIIPIPLSPNKAKAGEVHRTRLLVRELVGLIGGRVSEALMLTGSISKRNLLRRGLSVPQFKYAYERKLVTSRGVRRFERVLLVDDVCTEGTTLGCAVQAIKDVNPDCEIVCATAGQMITTAAVADETKLPK